MITKPCITGAVLTVAASSATYAQATFSSVDIGRQSPAGQTVVTNGGFDVSSATGDVWDLFDNFRFVYQRVSGDFDLRARIASLAGVAYWTKAGLMVREDLSEFGESYYWVNPRDWDFYASQMSLPIQLQAGRRYYLEALIRGDGSPNQGAVGWRLPDGKFERDISGTPVWQEDWNYDPTGNWRGTSSAYVTKVNGSTTLDQNRTHDKANEILTLTGTPDWVDPTHDAAGNTTKVPQPATPTSSYDCKFDAWDRLVEVKVTGGAVVSTLRYDGLKRRVTKVAGGNTRHYYYSNGWQVLEERLNALSTADRQIVWGIRHVDDLIERDRGSERFYVLHDHLSVTATINTTGAVQERYGYDGFGPQRVMDASFGARASSLYDWETSFAAYRLDTESGLCQVRHRFYHPKLGRWLSRDPLLLRAGVAQRHIEVPGGPNLYWPFNNDPISKRDPDGRLPIIPIICVIVAGVIVCGCAKAPPSKPAKEFPECWPTIPPFCPGQQWTLAQRFESCKHCCATDYGGSGYDPDPSKDDFQLCNAYCLYKFSGGK